MLYSRAMKTPSLLPLVGLVALGAAAPAAAQTPPAIVASFNGWRVVPSPATSIVNGVFARHRAAFAACDRPGVAGTVSLRMATDANGQVSTATVRSSTFAAPNTAVTACVLGVARRLMFPGSVQGTLDIEVVVSLSPPDAGAQ